MNKRRAKIIALYYAAELLMQNEVVPFMDDYPNNTIKINNEVIDIGRKLRARAIRLDKDLDKNKKVEAGVIRRYLEFKE